ncbi:uncharacterized protein LOC123548996 [Mercenaria mercenaria]|uniref:uncharacterized protein LOC123548996 n=1 Tax=Mercenaria mercenaria TaxID=6596 RepID=UPI00234F29A7|nr:uncharacterized protein LOC123548996 [Mercenaria mercenaria]
MDRGQENRAKLSRAIQSCSAELVDTQPFSDSELPDILIQDGCITEDECKEMRAKTVRKDQVRKLIILIKGRSFKTMKKYLLAINKHCPNVVKNVWNRYEILLHEKRDVWVCPMCELKENVDIKYVIDVLYGKSVIRTGLYSMVCDSNSSIGQQDYLWDSLLQACSGDNLKYLTDALKAKGHYTHIAESLNYYRRSLSFDSPCLCSSAGTPPVPRKVNSDENETSTTQSPLSSSFVSSREDENTSPKTMYTGKHDSIINSTNSKDNLQSDQPSDVSSAVTVVANARDDELLLPDADDNVQGSVIPSYNCICFCFRCCRHKLSMQNHYGTI